MSRPPLPEDLNTCPLGELYALLARGGRIRALLQLAHAEDLGAGDLTSEVMAITGEATADLVLREPGVVAGLRTLDELALVFGFDGRITQKAEDGDRVDAGTVLATLEGPAAPLLAMERTMLNLVGRLCGIATRTASFVAQLASQAPGTPARLFDTRKTTPGLRALEKYAVRCGGGFCHRLGLHDAVLIKDNHLAGLQGSTFGARVGEAAERAHRMQREGRLVRLVEVEVDRLEQLEAVLELPAGLIDAALLDNMPPPELARAVAARDRSRPELLLEASGGVTLETLGPIARAGVERISVGSLTHGARALDVGLDLAGGER